MTTKIRWCKFKINNIANIGAMIQTKNYSSKAIIKEKFARIVFKKGYIDQET